MGFETAMEDLRSSFRPISAASPGDVPRGDAPTDDEGDTHEDVADRSPGKGELRDRRAGYRMA